MDVRLSPEQQALRDSVAQVVDRLGPRAVGQLDDLERAEKLDAAVAASGWRELRVAEDGGAPLASGVEACIVAEELGRGLADTPFLGPTLAAELRRLAGAPGATVAETVLLAPGLGAPAVAADGTPAVAADGTPAVAADGTPAVAADGTPAVAADGTPAVAADGTPAVAADGTPAVAADGTPAVAADGAVAVDAHGAASALALRRDDGGHGLAEVALQPVAMRTDLTRPMAVPAGAPVPLAGQSRALSDDDVASWTALGLALTCADLVGVMRGAVEVTCEYAGSRKQYGTAIGSFQAVQHLLADAFVAMEGSRSVALHAAWAVDALPAADARAAASVAKAYCARAARSVCETAIQVHGGIGNTWECLAHVYLRRALLSTDVLGGAGASLARVLGHHGIEER